MICHASQNGRAVNKDEQNFEQSAQMENGRKPLAGLWKTAANPVLSLYELYPYLYMCGCGHAYWVTLSVAAVEDY